MTETGATTRRGSTAGLARTLAGRFALWAGAVLLLPGAAVLLRLPVADLGWSVTHHSTATGFGTSFRVPLGWRQVDRPEGRLRVDLRNAISDPPAALKPDQISFWKAPAPFDPVEEAQRWERLGTRLMVPGDRLEPTPRDPFLLAHARCSDVKRSADGRASFACFDKGGRWVAVYLGWEHGRRDLPKIIRSVLQATTTVAP